MKRFSPRRSLAAAALAAGLAGAAQADAAVRISASGVWNHDTVVTEVGAPDTSWSFSFLLPDVLAENPSAEASQFTYRLGNSAVDMTLDNVEFLPSGAGAMFILTVTLAGDTRFLQVSAPPTDDPFDEPDLGSNGVLARGNYDALLINIPEFFPTLGVGIGTVSLAEVPEPASWGLMILGFGAAGCALRRRRAASEAA